MQENSKLTVYISVFKPKTSNTKGHATLDVFDQQGQPVYLDDERKNLARLSVYPSSKPYQFPFLIQKVFDVCGFSIKTNAVGKITGFPIDGFSASSPEKDFSIEDRVPESIYQITDVSQEILPVIRSQQERLESGETKFLLYHNTGVRALLKQYVEKIYSYSDVESGNFYNEYNHYMSTDLIENGGSILEHVPDVLPPSHTNHNCASVIDHVLYHVGIFEQKQIFQSIYPQDLGEKLQNHGIKEVSFDILPSSMKDPIEKKKGECALREEDPIFRMLERLEEDPERIDVYADVLGKNKKKTVSTRLPEEKKVVWRPPSPSAAREETE